MSGTIALMMYGLGFSNRQRLPFAELGLLGKRLFPPLLSVSCGVHHLLGRHLHSGRLSCLGLAMVLRFTLRCIRLISAAGSRR